MAEPRPKFINVRYLIGSASTAAALVGCRGFPDAAATPVPIMQPTPTIVSAEVIQNPPPEKALHLILRGSPFLEQSSADSEGSETEYATKFISLVTQMSPMLQREMKSHEKGFQVVIRDRMKNLLYPDDDYVDSTGRILDKSDMIIGQTEDGRFAYLLRLGYLSVRPFTGHDATFVYHSFFDNSTVSITVKGQNVIISDHRLRVEDVYRSFRTIVTNDGEFSHDPEEISVGEERDLQFYNLNGVAK